MVYALYYLPLSMHRSLLAETHHFDDSKALTPAVRSDLMEKVCTRDTDLYQHCGWATRSLSARDISANQLRSNGVYNLNAQAMDATVELIQQVLDLRINVREVYIDTIGPPATYQKKLERIFPSLSITVAKKADSLYPCVSAASVCAKVTRDAALDVLYTAYAGPEHNGEVAWGSGYPSDARCTTWMRGHMHPMFGWGNEARFSWGTAKEMLEAKGAHCRADWPEPDDATDNMKLTGFLMDADEDDGDDMRTWFGKRVTAEVF
jgi:ribonuclease H2 subunit A